METATALAARLRRRELGAAELLEATLARIEVENPRLNALVALDAERALAAARAADAVPPPLPPLHGLPFSVKEQIAVAGIVSREASLLVEPRRAEEDAAAVARLRAAGAIPVGVTNMSELALFPDSVNRVHGATRNPYDPSLSAGGSSGGEACAVASGLVAFGLGSDYGGSIRCPAHFCGVHGLRPGPGVVPAAGSSPRVRTPARALLSAVGPLARGAADLGLVLASLAAAPAARLPARATIFLDALARPVDPRCLAAVEVAAQHLRQLGLALDEAEPPFQLVAEELFGELTAVETRLLLEELVPGREDDASAGLLVQWEAVRELEPDLRAYAAALSRLPALQEEARAWLGADRVLVAPAAATPAFELGRVDGVFERFVHCTLASAAGLPALVLPVPAAGPGPPVGVQLVGPPGAELTLVELARRLEG